jgi:hypothetical protein
LIATGEAAASLEELPALIRALIESGSEIVVVTIDLAGRVPA